MYVNNDKQPYKDNKKKKKTNKIQNNFSTFTIKNAKIRYN